MADRSDPGTTEEDFSHASTEEHSLFMNHLLFTAMTLLTIIGLVGNLTSFLVFTKGKHCSPSACSGYFQIVAVVDTLMILFPQLNMVLRLGGMNISLQDINDTMCSLVHFCSKWLAQTSVWIVTTVTVRRTLSVCLPLKFKDVPSKKQAYIICFSLASMFAILNLPVYFAPEIVYDDLSSDNYLDDDFYHGSVDEGAKRSNESGMNSIACLNDTCVGNTTTVPEFLVGCEILDDKVVYLFGLSFTPLYDSMIYLLFTFIGPISITMVCNGLIVVKLNRRVQGLSRQASIRRRTETMTVTRRVIAIGVVQCITISPMAILTLLDASATREPEISETLDDVIIMMFYMNYCLNVFLYAISGQDFRKDIQLWCNK